MQQKISLSLREAAKIYTSITGDYIDRPRLWYLSKTGEIVTKKINGKLTADRDEIITYANAIKSGEKAARKQDGRRKGSKDTKKRKPRTKRVKKLNAGFA